MTQSGHQPVIESTAHRIIGAASNTTGVIVAHEIIQDMPHWLANIGLSKNGDRGSGEGETAVRALQMLHSV